jgi:putative transposase
VSASRPVLRVGARVSFDQRPHTVVGFSGTLVRLADQAGGTSVVQLSHLLASDGFDIIDGPDLVRLPAATGALSGVPREAVDEAVWWEHHIVELMTGTPPDAGPDALARPEYDPATRSLTQRERAKADELAAMGGENVSARTVKRKRLRYQAQGLAGLIDRRTDRRRPVQGRTDPRVVSALRQSIGEATSASTRTASFHLWRTRQILADQYGSTAPDMPARATFYRLFERLTDGRHTTGSARTRRSLANRPDPPFDQLTATRPGEVMEIDSTPFDVMVLLDHGVPGRVELTGIVDLATRTVTAAVLRPTTKSVDASLLLARTLTPEPMRPGWAEALSMARSVLPHRRMLELDKRLAQAAARPVIVPEMIVCDHGKAFISHNFRSSCRTLGITFQPAHQDTPTEKPHIERTLKSVSTLFAQFVSGYLGRSAEYRGLGVEDQPLWSMMELQELLDEWLVVGWQNRPHDGLRDPVVPGRAFTPNEKYAALVETAGYLPVALSAQDYIALLPASWRAINSYGIKIGHRVYDGEELNPLRGQRSGVAAKKDLWEIHRDPYDVSRIWVRNHWDGGWITVFWKHLSSAPAPFGEAAWDHARQSLTIHGKTPTELEIAQQVDAVLRRANQGPRRPPEDPDRLPPNKASKKDRRVAARTKATAQPAWPRPDDPPPPHTPEPVTAAAEDNDDFDVDFDDAQIADVVPLKVFDARKEAERWW